MASGSRVTVTDVATELNTPDGSGQRLKLKNTGAGIIDLGGSGVTDGAGYELANGGLLDIEVEPGGTLYGISAAAASNIVEVLES